LRWRGRNPRHPQRRESRPPAAWAGLVAIFAALYASHFWLLGLPYYWDEAGYYIPAAWDFWRTGSPIPISTLTNAHPPGPSVALALAWRLAGFSPVVTRTTVLLVAALALTAVWRLALRLTGVRRVAFWTVLLTALYPIWFAQSALAHADIFAACGALWGMYFALPAHGRRPWAAALCFSLAALSKETAIVLPLTLALAAAAESRRALPHPRRRLLAEAAWLAGCLLPLAGWYAYHKAQTGFLFGNPEFLRYNAQANFLPGRFLAALFHRCLHLTAHMNLFVLTGMALAAALLLKPRPERDGGERARLATPVKWRIAALMAANLLFFSVLGGALLTRYLLPMYPLAILLSVMALYRRAPGWQAMTAVAAGAFAAALILNPPYRFAPEDNLAWTRVVRLHQAGARALEERMPRATVLTAWPASDELSRPELGYVERPFRVEVLPDFTAVSLATAAQHPERYQAALVFNTKYDPAKVGLSAGRISDEADRRYFGMHHDLGPEEAARALGGRLAWRDEDRGQWIGLIGFEP
jgi:4-amino-4-deoxy-L-arabinose transferase-like glycosyltransferase